MHNAVVNFKSNVVDKIRDVLDAGSEIVAYSSLGELNTALQRGNNFDKILFWHIAPSEEDDDSVFVSFEEELGILNSIISAKTEMPELWFMEKSRHQCRLTFENVSLEDKVIVQVQRLADLSPVLSQSVNTTVSGVLSSRNLVGLYDQTEYTADLEDEATTDDFEEDYEEEQVDDFEEVVEDSDFEEVSDDDFDEETVDDFEEASDDFEDVEEDEFEESSDDDFDEETDEDFTTDETPADDFDETDEDFTTDEITEDEFEEDDFEEENTDDFEEETVREDDEFDETDETDEFSGEEEIDEFEETFDNGETVAEEIDEFDDVEEELPKEEPEVVPTPVPVPTEEDFIEQPPIQEQAPQEDSTSKEDNADVKNATLKGEVLRTLKSICSKKCCQIVVTGEKGVGKSTVAMNIGGVLAKNKFRVLVVDMDGESRGGSYMLNDVIESIALDDSTMRSLFNSGLNSGNKPVTVRKNFSISTCGLSSDTFVTNDTFNATNVARTHNQLSKYFDFVIYDIPIEACVGKLSSFVSTSYLLYCVDASNYGFMEFLLRLGNLEETAISSTILESGILVPCKARGYKRVSNINCNSTKSAMHNLQRVANELVGGECELDFESMDYAREIPFDKDLENYWGSNKLYSDSNKGYKIYSNLVADIFGV